MRFAASPRLAILGLGLLLGACSSGRPDTYVVLLENLDGAPSAVTFSNEAGTARIEEPNRAVGAGAGRAPSEAFALGQEELVATFGPVLAAAPQPPVAFRLNFVFEGTELTPESQAQLPTILQLIGGRPAPEVAIIGHTDTVGEGAFNYELGLKRAETVRGVVIAAGVQPDMIEIGSHGEGNPLVPTPDETAEPRNRRVEVTVR
ncbi:MAG TPA: OmpA family protein [Alphaproteobacteria bacterium]|nr:OmpA family protein [Alphaproteobacteria bacterium]